MAVQYPVEVVANVAQPPVLTFEAHVFFANGFVYFVVPMGFEDDRDLD